MALAMTLSMVPQALAASGSDGSAGQVTIDAPGPELTVVGTGSALDPFAGLSDSDFAFTIDRDFDQNIWIPLRNDTRSEIRYYMTVDNADAYPDLSMNFVAYRTDGTDPKGFQGGYEGNPGSIGYGTSANPAVGGALLKVFAQEAGGETYSIQVTFHNMEDGTETPKTIQVTVRGKGMTLAESLGTPGEDGSVEVTLTNNGAAAINSLNVDLDETLAQCACFPTLIQNYQLNAGANVKFKVVPTAKLAAGQSVTGKLLVMGNGVTKEVVITLTKPAAPKTTTGAELAKDLNKLGHLTASDTVTAAANASDGSTEVNFSMASSKSSVGNIPVKVKISTEQITSGGTQPTLPSDDLAVDILDDGSKFWVDEPTVDKTNRKITIKLHQLIQLASTAELSGELDGEEDVSLLEDSVTAILKKFDLEIDFSQAGINDDFIDEYNKAIENDPDMKNINNANLPPKTKARMLAYRQMEILLELIEEKGTADQKKAVLDEFNEGLPEPAKKKTLDDYRKDYEKALNVYMENAKLEREKTVHPYVPEDDPNKKDYGDDDKKDWAQMDINENGSQCTNRGKITSSFHSTDTFGPVGQAALMDAGNTAKSKGIRVFYTGRINSEDNYINFEPITYKLSLKTSQGTQNIGTSVNTGLSELNIIELDPEKIPMGETIEFTRDYDINPGTHFVTTDNRYTIVYPENAEVPDDATGVHLAVPDYDVYKKNIFLLDENGAYVKEGIVGQNKLHVSISNRGAKGGYYQLEITSNKGGTLVDDKTDSDGKIYRYLPAFATQVLELPVTMSATEEEITVTVIDCSQRTKETEPDNNTAAYAISARNREVPVITSVYPADKDTTPTVNPRLTAYLTNDRDVTGATFTLTKPDGTKVKKQTIKGNNNFSINPGELAPGTTYTMTVEVTYKTGGMFDSSTGTVTSTTTFTTPTNTTWAAITLPTGSNIQTEDPEWALYTRNVSGGYYLFASGNGVYDVVKQGDGSYALTQWGTGANLDGKLLTFYDPMGRALYAGTVGTQGTAIDMTARRSLVLEDAEFDSEIISVSEVGSRQRTIAVEADKKTVYLPDIPVNISCYLNIDGVRTWFSKELVSGDYDANGQYKFSVSGTDSTVEKFSFTVPETEQIRYNVFYMYETASGSIVPRQLSSGLKDSTLTALRDKGDATGDNPFLCVTKNTGGDLVPAMYVIPIGNYSAGMSLAKLNTHKLTLSAKDPSRLAVQFVQVSGSWGSYPRLYAYGESLICTPGQYTVQVGYTYDGNFYSLTRDVDLTNSDQTIDLSRNIADLAQMNISWDKALGSQVELEIEDSNGKTYSCSLNEDGKIRLPAGTYEGTATCYNDRMSLQFELENLKLSNTAPLSLHLGAALTGTLKLKSPAEGTPLNANSWVTMSVSGVTDSNGNKVSWCSNFTGFVTFTPKDGGEPVVRQIGTLNNLTDSSEYSIRLPGKAGDYTTSFSIERPVAGDYTIVASAGAGGSITPHGNVPVDRGDSVTFTITPNEGYAVSSVLVDGADQGARSSYTFENVHENHTISASFRKVGSSGGSISGGSGGTAAVNDRWSIQAASTAHGKVAISPSNATKGATVKLTAIPDAGYELDSLTALNASGKEITLVKVDGTTYTFTMPAGAVTVRATFVPKGTSGQSNPFTDVSANDWFYDDVMAVHKDGLFAGTSATEFSPKGIMSRAMFVTVLSRFETMKNGTDIKGNSTFTDVPAGQWYTNGIAWAADLNVTAGYGNGLFGRDDSVTREQACTFLMRYLAAIGFDLSAYSEQVTFTDADRISSWAKESVGIAQQLGLIHGRGNGQFDPQASMTRSECAAVFHRLKDVVK